MNPVHWARLKSEAPYPLRRGAWYPVVELERHAVVVDAQWTPVSVPRTVMEVVDQRPLRWTVVPRPRGAVRIPAGWGDRYAVCPNCSCRASMDGSPSDMVCRDCEGRFPVAWEEKYLGRR